MNPRAQLPTRLRAKIHITDDGCWLWTGALTRTGYGHVRVSSRTPTSGGKWTTAHRAIWVALGRPLADRDDLHHLCGQRACVNPDHLEPLGRVSHRKTHRRSTCIKGHSNWITRPSGARLCADCEGARKARYAKRTAA